MSRLDWNDPEAVARWGRHLSTHVKDLRAVNVDMLAHPRAQQLGHAMHRQKCDEAYEAIVAALAHAFPPPGPPEGEPGGPAVH